METRDLVQVIISLITLAALIGATILGGMTWLVTLLWVLWVIGVVVSIAVARARRRLE
ncbi:hypothetical protein [Nocardiopsis sp. FIRDI 009]|uniref:hypothetical protein n=1 Tax=Nocardiopsis sp. FIRDI 009 TaxID=714197 RepID=UPI0018E5628A|nr:hypothetical protein [Nocardiopsis sp. FIRDI 009]